jgi:ABC transport system ATP-binding/permease protein
MRAARKDAQRSERELKQLERALDQLAEREAGLHEQMAANATDHSRLAELQVELDQFVDEREQLETSWLQMSESLEG